MSHVLTSSYITDIGQEIFRPDARVSIHNLPKYDPTAVRGRLGCESATFERAFDNLTWARMLMPDGRRKQKGSGRFDLRRN